MFGKYWVLEREELCNEVEDKAIAYAMVKGFDNALNEYGNIPVIMLISEIASEIDIEDIQADEESVALCNF